MPDITMCQGLNHRYNIMCPKRWDCNRFMATPTPDRQAYFHNAPFTFIKVEGECEYFMPVEKKGKSK